MKVGAMPVTQRATLKSLLTQDPGLLERGLVLIDEELEIGGARVDLLCADPARRPVLVYLVGGPLEEQEVPVRVLDGDATFRRHSAVLRRLLRGAPVDWELPPRGLVVGEELSRRTLERFEAFSALEVDLLELRSVRIRGEQRWAAVPVGGEAARAHLLPADALPPSLEDPLARNLWDGVLDRILKLDPGLEVVADRFHREILCGEHCLAILESGGTSFRVIIPAAGGAQESDPPSQAIPVNSEAEADLAVDLAIRRFLALRSRDGRILASETTGQTGAAFEAREPDSSLAGLELAVQASRLTEDELAAFFDDQEGRRESGS